MSGLTEFLLARIAEDEENARETVEQFPAPFGSAWVDAKGVRLWNGWTPTRVLAECKAKRHIVEDMRDELANQHDPEPTTLQLAERTLLALALPYADHPDFREEWRS